MATAQQLAFSLFIIIACVPHVHRIIACTRTNSQIQAQPTHRLAFSLTPRRYLGLNSFLNLLNRWALGLYGLRFPLIMTSCHMIFGSAALAPMMLMRDDYAARHATSALLGTLPSMHTASSATSTGIDARMT